MELDDAGGGRGVQPDPGRRRPGATLTAQLLAFSRDQVLRPRVVDLARSCLRMRYMFDRVLGEDINIVYDVRDGCPRWRSIPPSSSRCC